MATNYIKYTSRIKSSTADGVLLEADQMKDEAEGKLQSVINQETKTSIAGKANAADVYKKNETYTKGEVDTKVAAAIVGAYHTQGSKDTFAEVLALTNAKVGDLWDVKAKFTFGGKEYAAGTNVVCIKDTSASSHTEANWDPLGGITDMSAYSTTAEMNTKLATKVDKVTGKSLSTNDYTTAEKNKLAGIAAGAQVNTVTSVAGKTGAVTLSKSDVGLAKVDNTSDEDKPISTATQNALDLKADSADVTAELDKKVDKVTGKGLSTNDYTKAEKDKLAGIAAGAQVNTVTSVAGRTGAVTLSKSDVGLSNVENTSDANKPISTLAQNALNLKANAADVYKKTETYTKGEVDNKVANAIVGAYHTQGSKDTFAEVLALTNSKVGDVWNVKSKFTYGGKEYEAGTNVVCVKDTSASSHTEANWDPLGGINDMSAYSTTEETNAELDKKVDKEAGKGLSTNDYTTAEKNKLGNVPKLTFGAPGNPGQMLTVSRDANNVKLNFGGKYTETGVEDVWPYTVSAATKTDAGVMSAEDKRKVDSLVGYVLTGSGDINTIVYAEPPSADELALKFSFNRCDSGEQSVRRLPLPAATKDTAGVMTAADKSKLGNVPRYMIGSNSNPGNLYTSDYKPDSVELKFGGCDTTTGKIEKWTLGSISSANAEHAGVMSAADYQELIDAKPMVLIGLTDITKSSTSAEIQKMFNVENVHELFTGIFKGRRIVELTPQNIRRDVTCSIVPDVALPGYYLATFSVIVADKNYEIDQKIYVFSIYPGNDSYYLRDLKTINLATLASRVAAIEDAVTLK